MQIMVMVNHKMGNQGLHHNKDSLYHRIKHRIRTINIQKHRCKMQIRKITNKINLNKEEEIKLLTKTKIIINNNKINSISNKSNHNKGEETIKSLKVIRKIKIKKK